MVFFESGRAEISSLAEGTLRQFAKAAQNFADVVSYRNGKVSVFVSAHTDTAEASDALSIARGVVVHDRLIELGVPSDRISVSIHADHQLLVKTGPNTPEPQNRRVRMMFQTD
jgi:outer membrane protein OmpA-like peptidoglycan-associated protein